MNYLQILRAVVSPPRGPQETPRPGFALAPILPILPILVILTAGVPAQDTRAGFINLYGGTASKGLTAPELQGVVPPVIGSETLISILAPNYSSSTLLIATRAGQTIPIHVPGARLNLYLDPTSILAALPIALVKGKGMATFYVPPVSTLVGVEAMLQTYGLTSSGGFGASGLLAANVGRSGGKGTVFNIQLKAVADGGYFADYTGVIFCECNFPPVATARKVRISGTFVLPAPACLAPRPLRVVLAKGTPKAPGKPTKTLKEIPFPTKKGTFSFEVCIPYKDYIYIYNPNASKQISKCKVVIEITKIEDLGDC